jgi:hypothetical protein
MVLAWLLAWAAAMSGADPADAGAAPSGQPTDPPSAAPHTPTIVFYLSGTIAQRDEEAIRSAVAALSSASTIAVNRERGFARIRFDTHVISVHQVAQAISDAGRALTQRYDPRVVLSIPDYAKGEHALQVDRVLSGKRLLERVSITQIDRARGLFAISFHPLAGDDLSATGAPPGFNAGHLHHPLHDPPPRGLGLECEYLAQDDAAIILPPAFPSGQSPSAAAPAR